MGSSSPRAPTASDCDPAPAPARELDPLERRLLDEFQRDFPVCESPYAEIAARLQTTEAHVLESLERLLERGYVSRVGAVFTPRRIGDSVLAALAVPHGQMDEVAQFVNGFDEVNHNYEREHSYNLWFVVTAGTAGRVDEVIDEIERRCGLEALRLPLEHSYHIDLGFPLWT